jgi:hypothetical protein
MRAGVYGRLRGVSTGCGAATAMRFADFRARVTHGLTGHPARAGAEQKVPRNEFRGTF